MSQDQAEAHAQASAAPHIPTSAAQPDGSKVHAQPDRDQRKPVKAGRALLLLAVVAIALAYSGISGRHRDDEKLNQWTQERAVPPVAVVTPQRGGKTRELVLPGNVDAFYTASIHSQVMGYVQEWRRDIGAQVHQATCSRSSTHQNWMSVSPSPRASSPRPRRI